MSGMFMPRPPRFIRDSSLIRPVAFDKCLFLKIPHRQNKNILLDSLNNKFSNLSSGTTLFVNVTQPHFELQYSDIKIDTALTDF
jgi:hypothetical protein